MRHQSADCREARIPLPTAVGAPRRIGPVYAGSMNGCLRTLVHWTPELGGQDAWLEERRAAGWSPSTRGSPIRSSSTGGRCGLSPSSTSRTYNRGLSFAASACQLSSAGPRARRLRRVSDRGGWWSTAIEGAAGSARSVDAERALVDVSVSSAASPIGPRARPHPTGWWDLAVSREETEQTRAHGASGTPVGPRGLLGAARHRAFPHGGDP